MKNLKIEKKENYEKKKIGKMFRKLYLQLLFLYI